MAHRADMLERTGSGGFELFTRRFQDWITDTKSLGCEIP